MAMVAIEHNWTSKEGAELVVKTMVDILKKIDLDSVIREQPVDAEALADLLTYEVEHLTWQQKDDIAQAIINRVI